jgi:hypothetical protein
MFFPGRIGYENFQRAIGIALVLPIELELPRPPVKPDACGPEYNIASAFDFAGCKGRC